jgi:hypothetical protein
MKTRMLTVCAAAALLFAAGLAGAQAPAGAQAVPPAGAPGGRAGGPPSLDFFKTDDPRSNPFTRAQIEGWKTTIPSGSGPYGAVRGEPDTLPTNTIFYPKDLAKVKGKMPILSFANGACSGQPLELTEVYTELASQGFFVATIGRIGGTVNGGDLSLQIKFIDWAIAENDRKGSPFYNKLDTKKIGLSGQSCGGVMAIRNAGDPRVSTVLILNSGIFIAGAPGARGAAPGAPGGGAPAAGGGRGGGPMDVGKDALKAFHTPVAYLLGGPKDIAYANGVDDVEKIEGVPVFMASTNVGHLATYGTPSGGEFGKIAVDWFKYQLKGDKVAAKTFVGPDCKLCTNSLWEVKRKNM